MFPQFAVELLGAITSLDGVFQNITSGMTMRLTGIGSQYLMAYYDANKHYLDGNKTSGVSSPKDIPAKAFWSLTLYDNQTRSMLQTPQRFPRAGSQSYSTPAANPEANGSTIIMLAQPSPMVSRRAIGFNRSQAKAGSPFCGCTVHCNRSSIKLGA